MTWKNVPIPETIVVPLLTGLAVEFFFPRRFFQLTPLILLSALLLLGVGLALMAWSVRTAGKLDVSAPDALLTSGPYAISRNPMYVSWLIIHLAALVYSRSVWLAAGFVLALLLTHYLAILQEEKALLGQFGESYERYCERVRRYF